MIESVLKILTTTNLISFLCYFLNAQKNNLSLMAVILRYGRADSHSFRCCEDLFHCIHVDPGQLGG